jgi:hypothetical protein
MAVGVADATLAVGVVEGAAPGLAVQPANRSAARSETITAVRRAGIVWTRQLGIPGV